MRSGDLVYHVTNQKLRWVVITGHENYQGKIRCERLQDDGDLITREFSPRDLRLCEG